MTERTDAAPAHVGATDQACLSIGDVAEATGLSVDTIRAWERRYGHPRPTRLASGHRRYTHAQVTHLRRVAEAMARGHRPSRLLRADEETLSSLLEGAQREVPREVRTLLETVRRLDRDTLLEALSSAWRALTPNDFLEGRIAPLLEAVGRLWADGELAVRHEHFLSEVLEDTLRSLKLSLPPPSRPYSLVLATLPGESHGLGLQMLALMARLHGVSTHVLGTDTPLQEILVTVRETAATGALLSVSLATGGPTTDRLLADLRRRLPANVYLLVGGAGARGPRRGPKGITYLKGLQAFAAWVEALGSPDAA